MSLNGHSSEPLAPTRVRFSILGLLQPGISIEDPKCVTKSFPAYWDEFERFRAHHAAGAAKA